MGVPRGRSSGISYLRPDKFFRVVGEFGDKSPFSHVTLNANNQTMELSMAASGERHRRMGPAI
jgi:hypothetical protein